MILFSLCNLVSQIGHLTFQACRLFNLDFQLFIQLSDLQVFQVDSIFDLLLHLVDLFGLECT